MQLFKEKRKSRFSKVQISHTNQLPPILPTSHCFALFRSSDSIADSESFSFFFPSTVDSDRPCFPKWTSLKERGLFKIDVLVLSTFPPPTIRFSIPFPGTPTSNTQVIFSGSLSNYRFPSKLRKINHSFFFS